MDQSEGEEAIQRELARFADLANLYQLILQPELEANSAVRHRLRRLKQWDISTTHPLVLELLKLRAAERFGDTELAEALHVIESFILRRFLSGRAPQGLNRTFREAVNIFDTDEAPSVQLRRWLSTGRKHFFSDTELRTAIKDQPYYLNGRRAHRQLFLRWLEEEFGSREPVDTSALQIEHVMPQTVSTEWREFLAHEYPDADIAELHASTMHTLGNLTLTGYNPKLSNKGFGWKRREMSKSGLRLSSSVVANAVWGPTEIEARAELLADLIIEAWPGPVADGKQAPVNEKWAKLREILVAIPSGRWTSYGAMAAAIGSAAQPVGTYLANNEAPTAYRVLRSSGHVPSEFRWIDENDTRDPRALLEAEGIEFSASGAASREQFLDAEALSQLVSTPETPNDGDLVARE